MDQRIFCVRRPGHERLSRCSSFLTIMLVKSLALLTLIPSDIRSYCWSSNLMAAEVSKTMLIPFITNGPLICNAIAAKNAFVLSKVSGNGFAVWVSGSFYGCLQGFRSSTGSFCWYCLSGIRFLGRYRSKGKNSSSCWHFARHIKAQTAAGWYVYGLRNAHEINHSTKRNNYQYLP